MKRLLLAILFTLPLTLLGQMDSLTKAWVEKLLAGFKNRFGNVVREKKVIGGPGRTFVTPGLLGDYDELQIWGDTSCIYASSNDNPIDSLEAMQFLDSWDRGLKEILGDKYIRSVENFSFQEDSCWPIKYEYQGMAITIGIGKYRDKGYLTMVIFRGVIPRKPHPR